MMLPCSVALPAAITVTPSKPFCQDGKIDICVTFRMIFVLDKTILGFTEKTTTAMFDVLILLNFINRPWTCQPQCWRQQGRACTRHLASSKMNTATCACSSRRASPSVMHGKVPFFSRKGYSKLCRRSCQGHNCVHQAATSRSVSIQKIINSVKYR